MSRFLSPLLLTLSLWCCAASMALAISVGSVSILDRGAGAGFLPWVIAADQQAYDGSADRHLIRCQAHVFLDTGKYEFVFRLKKSDGTVHTSMASHLNIVGAASPLGYDVLPGDEPTAGGFDLSSGPQLDPYSDYTVEVEIRHWVADALPPEFGQYESYLVPIKGQSEAHRFIHFTSTSSNDVPLNVIGEVANTSVMLNHDASGYSLNCSVAADYYRFDGFLDENAALAQIYSQVQFTLTRVDTGVIIPLEAATLNFDAPQPLLQFFKQAGIKNPATGSVTQAFVVKPAAVIDPTAHQYSLSARLKVGPQAGPFVSANSMAEVPSKMVVDFPPGCGWTSNARDCILNPNMNFTLVAGEARWKSTVGNIWVMDEGKPLLFLANWVYWDPATGTMSFDGGAARSVRKPLLDDLALVSNVLANSEKALKRSNDHAFNGAIGVAGDVSISSSGQLTASVVLARSAFYTHFPHNAYIDPAQGGDANIVNNGVAQGSTLNGVAVINLPYSKACWSCPEGGAGLAPQLVSLQPTGGVLTFTLDGGLHAAGGMLNAQPLAWGRVPGTNVDAHTINTTFPSGAFLMAGQRLAGGQGTEITGPAKLLLTGYKLTTDTLIAESYGSQLYGIGAGDYAGMNFRCSAGGPYTATSQLAGHVVEDYVLAADSKYVVRAGGLTGRHNAQAMAAVAGEIYGFTTRFDSFGLTFLDNTNDHQAALPTSRVAGQITIPEPSNFVLTFEHISFTCTGNVAEIKPPSSFHGAKLAYWHLPFTSGDVSFPLSDACTVPATVPLQMQIKAFAQQVPEPLFANVGFWPSGQLVRPYDSDPANPAPRDTHGITSSFSLPDVIRIGGPITKQAADGSILEQEHYRLEPIADAYLNHEGIGANRPDVGFFSVVGLMDVPFFQAMQVQVHLSSAEADAPFNAIMGGWPNAGWSNAASNFFTDPNFDSKHEGFPVGITLDDYQNGVNAAHQPHVLASWLNQVNIDHPVKWSKATRVFEGRASSEVDVFVTNIDCSVPLLTPKRTEIKFGASFNGLPHLSLANMAYNAVENGTGLLDAFFDDELKELNETILKGTAGLADLLADDSERVLGPVIGALLVGSEDNDQDGQLAGLVDSMFSRPVVGLPDHVSGLLDGLIGQGQNPEATTVLHVLGLGNDVPQLVGDISAKLDQAIAGIDALASDSGLIANSGKTVQFLSALSQAVPLPDAVQVAASDLNGLYENNAAPTMKALQRVLLDLRARLVLMKAGMTGDGLVTAEVRAYAKLYENALRSALINARDAIAAEVQASVAHGGVRDKTKAEWQALMKRELTAAVLANSDYVKAVRDMLRSRLQVIESALREGFDQWLATLNDTLREAISRSLAQLDQKINAMAKFSPLKGGQFDGYAHINGDTLSELRINAKLGLAVPDEMEFKGYLLVKDVLASGGGGCYNGSVTSAYLIELGALDVPLKFGDAGVHADVAAKFAFISINNGIATPRSFGGSFEMRGKLQFQSMGIADLKAAMMFTLPFGNKGTPQYFGGENYISGFCDVDMGGDGLAGGIFFGRACSTEPIKLWDPMVANLLGENRVFSGVYTYAEGRLPILDFGCPLNVSAGVGAGLFVFADGPEVGGRYHLEVKGEALCAVTVKGEVDLAVSATIPLSILERLREGEIDVGATASDLMGAVNGMKASGKLTLKGKVGWCPCCVKAKKSLMLTYKNRKFSADY